MKISKVFMSIATEIFPFEDLIFKNREIQNNIDHSEGVLKDIPDAEKIDISILKQHYEQTFSVKDKFEDKAKSQIFAITVAITVIFGASNMLKIISEKYSLAWVHWIVFILYVAATIFFIIAGVLAIRLLMHENKVSVISLASYMNDSELREEYSIATDTNIYRNIKRNNYVFTSYQCMRNALICLFAVSVITIIPITPVVKTTIAPTSVGSQILYSSEASTYLISRNNQSEIEQAVIVAENSAILLDGKTIGFVDDTQNIFIQAKREGSQVYVFHIFDYIK